MYLCTNSTQYLKIKRILKTRLNQSNIFRFYCNSTNVPRLKMGIIITV